MITRIMPKGTRPLFSSSSFLAILFILLPTSVLLLLSIPNPTTTTPASSLPYPVRILAVEQEQQHAYNPVLQLPPKSIIRSQTSNSHIIIIKQQQRNRHRRRHRHLLGFLRPTPQSKLFSDRAALLFNHSSTSSSPCTPRFFMTWISPLDSFGTRELLSVQTLFRSHPNACLLIASHSLDSPRGRLLLGPLSARGFRVAALSPDYPYLFSRTPAAAWFDRLRRGDIPLGGIPIGQNLSNLLRLALLHKYGGVYIDTDVIVVRSFLALRNTIGAQAVDARTGNWTRLNNAVLVFDRNHPLLYSFIEEFAATFSGSKWGHNGPYLVSRVASRWAGTGRFEFTVVPPPAFYPVDWGAGVSGIFRGPKERKDSVWVSAKLSWIRKESFALHLWSRQSRRLSIEAGSVVERILMESCVSCC